MAGSSRSTGPIAAGERRPDADPGSRAPGPAEPKRRTRRRDPLLDPDAPSWTHTVSIALCVLLVLAALIALALKKPDSIELGKRGFGSAAMSAPTPSRPIVEPLARGPAS